MGRKNEYEEYFYYSDWTKEKVKKLTTRGLFGRMISPSGNYRNSWAGHRDTFLTHGWVTDGTMLLKPEPAEAEKLCRMCQEHKDIVCKDPGTVLPMKSIETVLDTKPETCTAHIIGVRFAPDGSGAWPAGTPYYLIKSDKSPRWEEVAAPLYCALTDRFPDAQVHLSQHPGTAIAFIQDGEVRAVVMPMAHGKDDTYKLWDRGRADIARVPEKVLNRLREAISSQIAAAESLKQGRIADQQNVGGGRYEAEVWLKLGMGGKTWADEVIEQFYTFAPKNNVDPDAVLRELNQPIKGELTLSDQAREWVQDFEAAREKQARNNQPKPTPKPTPEPAETVDEPPADEKPEEPEKPAEEKPDLTRKMIFTTGQAAKICKVAPRTLAKWFDSGRLKGYRIPGTQDRRIPRASLLSFLKEHHMDTSALEPEEQPQESQQLQEQPQEPSDEILEVLATPPEPSQEPYLEGYRARRVMVRNIDRLELRLFTWQTGPRNQPWSQGELLAFLTGEHEIAIAERFLAPYLPAKTCNGFHNEIVLGEHSNLGPNDNYLGFRFALYLIMAKSARAKRDMILERLPELPNEALLYWYTGCFYSHYQKSFRAALKALLTTTEKR